jgi:hypothetical protein
MLRADPLQSVTFPICRGKGELKDEAELYSKVRAERKITMKDKNNKESDFFAAGVSFWNVFIGIDN